MRSWLEAAAAEPAEVALVDALLRVLRLLPLHKDLLEASGGASGVGRRALLALQAAKPALSSTSARHWIG